MSEQPEKKYSAPEKVGGLDEISNTDLESIAGLVGVPGEKSLPEISKGLFPTAEFAERNKIIKDRFENGGLLVHSAAMEQINQLISTFDQEGGIKNLSTSLIIEGGANFFYSARSTGLLIDGEGARLYHISKEDSCSYGGESGKLHASGHAEAKSLKELAEYIKSPDALSINEVNVGFESPQNILGILGRNSVRGKIDAAIMYIVMDRRLPIFISEEKQGDENKKPEIILKEWLPTKEDMTDLIKKYPVARGRLKYEKILKYFN